MHTVAQALLGIGLRAQQLGAGQAALRAILIYAVTLAIVRLGKKRFLARASAFDVIVSIVIGSLASRAVTASAPLGTTFAGIAAILAMHWAFSALALRVGWFGRLIKGDSDVLVRGGTLDSRMLKREHMTDDDLAEDLRQKGRAGLDGIKEARLERSGRLSIIAESAAPRVVEIRVEAGVQFVRVELS